MALTLGMYGSDIRYVCHLTLDAYRGHDICSTLTRTEESN